MAGMTVYYPEVECKVEQSRLAKTVVVAVADENNDRQFLRVGEKLVNKASGKSFLPVGIIEIDLARNRALIQLPYEADSGLTRLWVPLERIRTAKESKSTA
jgi:hypothetical protein